MDHVLDFVSRVLEVRLKWDFSVTSWGRTPARNALVKGVAGSLHMMWTGIDIVLDVQEKRFEFEKDCTSVGLRAIYEEDHYHLQPSG